MDKETIIEGNKLIAARMQLRSFKYDIHSTGWNSPIDNSTCFRLEYHTSWDWQIPAWSKISHLTQKAASDNKYLAERHLSYADKYESAIFTNNLEEGFKVLVSIITWYNTLPNTKK